MNLKRIDFLCGITFQFGCLILILSGGPFWLAPLSVFVGMWWAVGIYRHIYDWIKRKIALKSDKQSRTE